LQQRPPPDPVCDLSLLVDISTTIDSKPDPKLESLFNPGLAMRTFAVMDVNSNHKQQKQP
jgi:hypothetical protein